MRKVRRLLTVLCSVAATAWLSGQTTPAPQSSRFRSGIDLLQVDVSVLDGSHNPVRGLTADDFVLKEDGVERPIEGFAAVDLPEAAAPSAAWMRRVSADVVTNDFEERRLFVILMDDAMMINWPTAVTNAKKIAHGVIDRMGPNDLAAVLFTRDNRYAQNFTADVVRLGASVDKLTSGEVFAVKRGPTGPSAGPAGGAAATPAGTKPPDPDEFWYRSSVRALTNVADFLSAVPNRRKTLVYVSIGLPVDFEAMSNAGLGAANDPELRELLTSLYNEMLAAVTRAQRSNVNVYTYDPAGLDGLAGYFSTPLAQNKTAAPQTYIDYLRAVADETGGRATLDTNAFDVGLTQMFHETAAYYILGYREAAPKSGGHFSRLDVSVKKPGLEVRARKTNYTEKADDEIKVSAPATSSALAGVLPNPDAALRVTAAPFAAATPNKNNLQTVALVLGLREPPPDTRTTEHIDLATRAFLPDGTPQGSQTQTADVTIRAASPEETNPIARCEVLSEIALKPGRYQLRLAASNTTRDKTGSVFIDVDVPDFAAAPLSLSGVVLDSTSAPYSAPKGALKTIVPIVPTTERAFDTTDQATAFLRAYEGGKNAIVPVTLAIRISDEHDAVVFEKTETLGADAFAATRGADITFDLPLSRLKSGAHLLSFEATTAKAKAARDVVFRVK